MNSPQSRWAGSRRDVRPPGPIVIVQRYGAVWSTEKHNPKQDLSVCPCQRTRTKQQRGRPARKNRELPARSTSYRAPALRISRRKTQDCAVSTERQRRTSVSCGSIIVERFRFWGLLFGKNRIARTSYQDQRLFSEGSFNFSPFFANVEMNSVDGRPILQVVVLYSHKSD